MGASSGNSSSSTSRNHLYGVIRARGLEVVRGRISRKFVGLCGNKSCLDGHADMLVEEDHVEQFAAQTSASADGSQAQPVLELSSAVKNVGRIAPEA